MNLIKNLHDSFVNSIKPKLVIFFEQVDDSLFDLANKADTNSKQTLYFESMMLIRKSRIQISKSFFTSLTNSYNTIKNPNKDRLGNLVAKEETQLPTEFELVDESELDEKLAKTNLINKSDMAYHRYLFALSLRISKILGSNKIENDQISISPHQIVNAFSHSLTNIKIETTPKLILYKTFERSIMGQLTELYTNANQTLADAGIIPDIKYNVHNRNKNSKTAPKTDSNNLNSTISSDEASNQSELKQPQEFQQQTDPNYELISQLFQSATPVDNINQSAESNTSLQNQTNSTSSIHNQQPLDMNSIINTLSQLQNNVLNQKITAPENKSPTEIKDMLKEQLENSEHNNKKMQQKDSDTVDLVGMLFQFIVDDRDLPNQIQVIIAKLQIPYMKIALYDRNVFADKKHPARLLLDDLSVESVGWSEETDPKFSYKNKVNEIVNDILELEEYENSYFEKLKSDFNSFVKKSKRKTEVLQKRSIEKRLGLEKSTVSNEETAKLLLEKMKGKRMPLSIRHLLLGDWSKIIILTQLRHGKDSYEYRDKVEFIDKLLKFIQPSKAKINKHLIVKSLLQQYKKGLEHIIFGKQEILEKQKNLLKCFSEIHKLTSDSEELDNITELVTPTNIVEPSEGQQVPYEIGQYIERIINSKNEPEHTQAVEDLFSKMVEQVKVGTWFEFFNIQGKDVKVKLSWVSPITGKHLFVNARGLKFTNETREHLAELLREKAARILKNEPLFDRALSSIANQLKQQQEKSA